MTNRKNRVLYLMIFLVTIFILASCGSSKNSESNSNSNDNTVSITSNNGKEEKQKYIVDLNMDNYTKYLDIRYEPYGSGSNLYFRVCFYGSLSYAYYDDVVITNHFSRSNFEETDTDIKLSAGGYAYWYTLGGGSGSGTNTITKVSGKVIYWI